jgi:putative two-component system response regulator
MNMQIKTIFGVISDMIGFRDDVTGGHLDRTCEYLRILIARMAEIGVHVSTRDSWDIELLLCSAHLHDVGKIAISESILNKPGRLTTEEYEIIKTHAAIGAEIIDRIGVVEGERHYLRYARSIAASHHEKWDGSGYPIGIYGRHIPLEGRLMAIADVYDALISNRPYKSAMLPSEAATIIEEGSGTHFDPHLVDVFRAVAPQFARIATVYVGSQMDIRRLKETHMTTHAMERKPRAVLCRF